MRPFSRQGGFSIIELMVGVAVGLIAIMVMTQAYSNFQSQRRLVGASADSIQGGAIGVHLLERDLRQAGSGFNDTTVFSFPVCHGLPSGAAAFNLLPVEITQGAAAGDPDTLVVMYGNSASGIAFEPLSADYNAANMSVNAAVQTVGTFVSGDWVLLCPSSAATLNCMLAPATGGVASNQIPVTRPVACPAGAYPAGTSRIYNLGPAPTRNEYTVVGGRLNLRNLITTAAASEVMDNVVSLQAQYMFDVGGVLTPSDTQGANAWSNLRAIRVAIVSRSNEPDCSQTSPAPTVFGGTLAVDVTTVPISGGATWQCYRYKTFETVVPLRNMAWRP